MKLYRVRRGIGFNDDAYVITIIPGNMESLKFLTHLKKIIDTELLLVWLVISDFTKKKIINISCQKLKKHMKISDFLKQQGVFTNDIKARFTNGQIRINGDVIKEDIDLNVKDPTPDLRFLLNWEPFEAGDWIFTKIISGLSKEKKDMLFLIVNLFDIETLFSGGCQLNNKPVEEILPELNVMKGNLFLRTSKKQMFILKCLKDGRN